MIQFVKYVCEELDGASVSCAIENSGPWFKAYDAATVLNYKDTDKPSRMRVADDDKSQRGFFNSTPVKKKWVER